MTKDKDEAVALHELMLANNIELDALVQLLVRKGIITETELLEEIREMKTRMFGSGQQGSA